MWFKALRIYQLRSRMDWTLEQLQQALQSRPFQACGSQQEHSAGWVSPTHTEQLVHQGQGAHFLLQLRVEERLLPGSVIREALDEKVARLEAEENRHIGRKERRQLQDDIRIDLLPRAFTRSRRISLWIDLQQQRLILNTTSDKQAELALNLLREALGSLPVVPLNTRLPATQVMTRWLLEGQPAGFTLGDTCELRDPELKGAIVRCRGQDLGSEEIIQHLQVGKRVTQLRLNWQDQLDFTLNDSLQLKSLAYADELLQEADNANPQQDAQIALDTEFVLMTGCLVALINRLIDEHQGLADALHPDSERRH